MPILIGSHSQDHTLSTYLANRRLVTVDGKPWPPLEGMVSVDESAITLNNSPRVFVGVQVECVFHFLSPVTGIEQDKVLFSEMKILESDNCSADNGRLKCKFSFQFGSKSLAPSMVFDFPERQRISWVVVGFVAKDQTAHTQYCSRDDFKIIAQAVIPFQVCYKYTEAGIQKVLPAILNATSAKNLSFALFKPNIHLQVSLEKAMLPQMSKLPYQGSSNLTLTLNLNNTSINTRILNIKLTLHQRILVQVSSVKNRFKRSVVLYDDADPSPAYQIHPAGNQLNYNLTINTNEIDLESILKNSKLAKQVINFEAPEHGGRSFTPSTIYSRLDGAGSGVEVEYSLKILVSVSDDTSSKPIEFLANLPLVVSAEERDATTSEESFITADEFLPKISSLIEDIKFARDGLDFLIADWDHYRSSQSERMCTESADHALVILQDMMGSFQLQVGFFEEFIRNPSLSRNVLFGWPDESGLIPFNMLLLELELLVRANPRSTTSPDSVERLEPLVVRLLVSAKRFLHYAYTITVSWIRGEVLADADKSSLLNSYHSEIRAMYDFLVQIADGNDCVSGSEHYAKYQSDLSNALNLSKLA